MKITKCVDCCFLIHTTEYYSENKECALEKLTQYDTGIVKYDSECNPTIKGAECPYKRNKNWLDQNMHLVGQTMDEVEKYLIQENGFPYSVFIYEQNDIDIKEAVNQILQLDHLPKYLHITFKYMNEDIELLTHLVKTIEKSKETIKYKLTINLEKDLDNFYESYLAFRLNVNTPFVGIVNDNFALNPNLTTELSTKIQKDFLSFPYATTSKDNEFIIFPVEILEEYLSFTGSKFIDKILETQCPYKLDV